MPRAETITFGANLRRVCRINEYNLDPFRLCCVCGDREELEQVARDVYDGLLDEIEDTN